MGGTSEVRRRFGVAAALAVVAAAIGAVAVPAEVHAERAQGDIPTSTQTVLVSSANPSQFGLTVTFSATVTICCGGSSGVTAGSVAFSDGATVLGTVPVGPGGLATFSTASLTVGAHTITASYGGNPPFWFPSSDSLDQVVNLIPTSTTLTTSLNPSLVGDPVTFTATVNPAPLAGNVTFVDGPTVLGTVPVGAGGQATLTISSLAAGSHAITADFSGNPEFSQSSGSLTQQVNELRPPDSITLASSLNPSTFGDAVTFTAIVFFNGQLRNDGFVGFMADGVLLAPGVVPDDNGQATLTTSALAVGVHEITVSWSLSPSNFVLTDSLTQQVNGRPPTDSTTTSTTTPASTTTPTTSTTSTTPGLVETVTELSSSVNPSVFGQPVTFTATVTPVGGLGFAALGLRSVARLPRQVADGGTLTISDGDTVLAVVPVEADQAAFTTSSLSPGAHTITAAFSGTATAASSSTTLTQQVNQPAQLPATR
jgi:hypothetical protein